MIYLTQWLCPKRHCSIALLWDDETSTAEAIAEEGEGFYKNGLVGRVCAICRSTKLKLVHGRTSFKTMEEAMPFVKQTEAANMAARVDIPVVFWDSVRGAYEQA